MGNVFSNLLFKNGALYQGQVSSSRMLANIKDGKVYKGSFSTLSNILFTVKSGKVFKGNSTTSSNCCYTINDGKVYQGGYVSSSKQVLTVKNGQIYKGSQATSSNLLGSIDGAEGLATEYVVGLLCAINFLAP